MKPTQEERLSGMRDAVKLVKTNLPGWKKIPKWASLYAEDVTWLMRELAKAGKGLRLGDTEIKI